MAKAVWNAISTIYFDGVDTSQAYDLKKKVMRIKQVGGQTSYNNFQGLWREIGFCRLNSMKCAVDIHMYNSILQEDRVYTFLNALDNRLDKVCGVTYPDTRVEE